jgi:Gas vesicle protein
MTIDARTQSVTPAGGHEPANLGDILERVLDRGIVIVGDIRISLLDIELLTVKLRLLIASVDTARELGIDWWRHDPWLTSQSRRSVPTTLNRTAIEDAPYRDQPRTAREGRLTPTAHMSGEPQQTSEADLIHETEYEPDG